jgi:hypothetical protein
MFALIFAKLSGIWTAVKLGFGAFRFFDKRRLRAEGAERERRKALEKVIERTEHADKIRHGRNPAKRGRVSKFDRRE